MRRAVAVLLPLLLAVSACGGGSEPGGAQVQTGTLADVTVTGPTTSKPRVDFNAPLSFATTSGKVVDRGPGTGDAVQPSSRVTVDYVGLNASDGAEFASSWKSGKPATFNLSEVIPGFAKGLQGTHAGDRVVLGVASKDGYDPTGNGSSIRKGDSLVFVVDVRRVIAPLTQAELPELRTNAKDQPKTFVSTSQTASDLSSLSVVVLKQGDGPAVTAGQTITAEYLGQLYPDGKVFDESYTDPKPRSFPIGVGSVIEAWDQGLVGQKVGSRVLLAVPSALGYGATGSDADIPPNADLIFVIDIVKAA